MRKPSSSSIFRAMLKISGLSLCKQTAAKAHLHAGHPSERCLVASYSHNRGGSKYSRVRAGCLYTNTHAAVCGCAGVLHEFLTLFLAQQVSLAYHCHLRVLARHLRGTACHLCVSLTCASLRVICVSLARHLCATCTSPRVQPRLGETLSTYTCAPLNSSKIGHAVGHELAWSSNGRCVGVPLLYMWKYLPNKRAV